MNLDDTGISTRQLLATVAALTGGTLEHDCSPLPVQPLLRAAIRRLGDTVSDDGINPQPLPPRSALFAAIADELAQRAAIYLEISSADSAAASRAIIVIGGYIERFANEFTAKNYSLKWPSSTLAPAWFPTDLRATDFLILASRFEVNAGLPVFKNLSAVWHNTASHFLQTGIDSF